MNNLEPIEDTDLDVRRKFGEKKEINSTEEPKKESMIFASEEMPQRQEGVMEKEQAYAKILAKTQATASSDNDPDIPVDAKITSKSEGVEAKIETLIKLATTKSVVHAVKVARHLDDNYVLDEFHDRLLSEELHDALIKSGLIKEI